MRFLNTAKVMVQQPSEEPWEKSSVCSEHIRCIMLIMSAGLFREALPPISWPLLLGLLETLLPFMGPLPLLVSGWKPLRSGTQWYSPEDPFMRCSTLFFRLLGGTLGR